MGLPKGRTNNPGGRKKGVVSIIGKPVAEDPIKRMLLSIIKSSRKNIQRDLRLVSEYQRLTILEKFMSYVIPKAVAATDIDNLTPQQIDNLLTKIIEAHERNTETPEQLQDTGRNESQKNITEGIIKGQHHP